MLSAIPADALQRQQLVRSTGFDVFLPFGSCQSLADISNGLRSDSGNLNHLEMEHSIAKSSLSDVNAKSD